MSEQSDNVINRTVTDIFANNEAAISVPKQAPKKRGKRASKRDLELATAVLLVELASADQNFDPREYQMICTGMRRMFGTTKDQVQALVNQANLVLANLRGTSKLATLLKNNLDQQGRETVMEVINDVIAADGVEDGFEIYLRNKYASLLGLAEE